NATTFGRYAPTPGVVFLAPDSPANPTPGSNTYLYHRFAAAGNRDDTTTTNTYDILLGFRGAISDSIDADLRVRYNTTQFTRLGRNDLIGTLAQQAINDGSYNLTDPASTPVNVLNSIKHTITRDSYFTIKEAYGNLTFNDLFEMGGGGASLAVGGEFRKEDFADQYDS